MDEESQVVEMAAVQETPAHGSNVTLQSRPCRVCGKMNYDGVDFPLSKFFVVRLCRDCGRGIANAVLRRDPPHTMHAYDRNVMDENGDPMGSVADAIGDDLLDPTRIIIAKWRYKAEWYDLE